MVLPHCTAFYRIHHREDPVERRQRVGGVAQRAVVALVRTDVVLRHAPQGLVQLAARLVRDRITYTDGTSQSFPLTYADWWADAPTAGDDILTSLPYINQPYGRQDQAAVSGATTMHIFAIAIG